MDRRRNILVGIVVALVVVVASVYASGLSERLLAPFGTSAEYESAESAMAPALAHGDWINSEPLKLENLQGRVVLVEFWTFGCINCRNTLPFVESWYDRYREKGLTVIGVHSPEFPEERNVDTLRSQVVSRGIKYPVVSDNDYQTWNAYDVHAWPTMFMVDKQGRIRWKRIGEGNYDETEKRIQQLLAE